MNLLARYERGRARRDINGERRIDQLADNLRKYCAWRRKYHTFGWRMREIRVERILLGRRSPTIFFSPSSLREKTKGKKKKKKRKERRERENRKRAHFSTRTRGSYLSPIPAEKPGALSGLSRASLIFLKRRSLAQAAAMYQFLVLFSRTGISKIPRHASVT